MELFNIALSTPVLPATILLCVMLCWAVMSILGAIDFHHVLHLPDMPDTPDITPQVDPGTLMPDHVSADIAGHAANGGSGSAAHAGAGAGKVGFSALALRWFNLTSVPIIVWLCIFSLTWWTLSALVWSLVDSHLFEQPSIFWSSILIVRNLIVAGLLTKVITGAIGSKFSFTTPSTVPQDLIGKECVISSSEATPDFGLVKFPTGGAPLLLNVRTDGVHLPKGTTVWITHYDRKRRVYIVSPTTTKSPL